MKKSLIVLIVIVALAAAIFAFSDSQSSANIELTASVDKETYTVEEPIDLTIHLENTGDAEACVSDMTAGSVQIMSLTKDGTSVETRTAPSYFLAALPMLLEANLVPVPSGERTELTLSTFIDEGLGTRAFQTTVPDDSRGLSTLYAVGEPGEYTLTVAYEYNGSATEKCPSVLQGRTNTTEVTFTVTP